MIDTAFLVTRRLAIAPLAAVLLAACGGGGDDDASASTPTTAFDQRDWGKEAYAVHALAVSGSWNANKGDTGNSILRMPDGLYIYHSGQDASDMSSIGLVRTAGSIDAKWTPYADEPIFVASDGAAWEAAGVYHPSVLKQGSGIVMFYTGKGADGTFRIGRARSIDGIHFQRESAVPVVNPGADGTWDSGGVDQPSVIYDGRRYVMLYRGWPADPDSTDTHSQIGLATSEDGIVWTKSAVNPVLRWGAKDSWDEHGLLAPRLWLEDGVYHANFSGKSNGITSRSASSIGHATSVSLEKWTKSPRNPTLLSGDTRWYELEWATPYREGDCWYLLTPAWVEAGATVVWRNCAP